MKKWLMSLIILAAMLLGACNDEKVTTDSVEVETNNDSATAFPVTVTDALGKEITIEEQPKKIVSLIQSNTEILFELGLDKEIVGVNDFDNYPPEVENKERIGSMEFNIEKIISLQPDIVFAHESSMSTFEAGIEQLEAAGITVFVVKNAINFDETYITIEQIGQLTGKQEQAKAINEHIQKKLTEIQAKVKNQTPKSSFLLVGATPDIYAAGKNTFMDEMLKAINVTNVVDQNGWIMYSAEDFVASNPDTIIVTYAEDVNTIKNNPAFAKMNAVKNNTLMVVDGDTTSRQGPRLAEGVESIAKAIYPEAFSE